MNSLKQQLAARAAKHRVIKPSTDTKAANNSEWGDLSSIEATDYKPKTVDGFVAKSLQANKDSLDQMTNVGLVNKAAVCQWLIKHGIVYVASQSKNPFTRLVNVVKHKAHDRTWSVASEKTLRGLFRMTEGKMPVMFDRVTDEGTDDEMEFKFNFEDCCMEIGQWFTEVTSTFETGLQDFILNKMVMEQEHWIPNDAKLRKQVDATNQDIDTTPLHALLCSLSGGKDDQRAHIAQSLLFKLYHPERCQTLPAMNIFGCGGVGKGVFVERLLPTLFHGENAAREFKTDALTGFNKDIESATVVVMNEADNDKRHENMFKLVFGSKKIRIEPKGVDPYYVDNTAWYWLMTNDSLASVSIGHDDNVSRRYSLISVDKPLTEYVPESYDGEPSVYISKEIIPACDSRMHVLKFVDELVERYGIPEHCPKAFHGEAFQEVKSKQTDVLERTLTEVVRDLVAAVHDNEQLQQNKIQQYRQDAVAAEGNGELTRKAANKKRDELINTAHGNLRLLNSQTMFKVSDIQQMVNERLRNLGESTRKHGAFIRVLPRVMEAFNLRHLTGQRPRIKGQAVEANEYVELEGDHSNRKLGRNLARMQNKGTGVGFM